ncbi:MAG: putative peptidoglycan biosynthesis protein MurJ [Candidatus Aminicenantes bacterium ADurb.Bin508]|nr:MAG: putative peptidoglycan biosynthesis protein MurJ [Candidatus Aminicenantes bacterium ADurb.Bin508]
MNRVLKSAVLLALIGVVVKLLGPLKNYLIADRFGVSRTLDAYYLSQNVVDVVLAVVTFTITVLVVPLFTEEAARRGEEKEALLRSIDAFLCQTLLVAVVACVLTAAFSQRIAGAVPGFADATVRADFVRILRILSTSLLFAIPFSVIAGYLYSTLQVVLPSLLGNVALVVSLLFLLFTSRSLGVFSLPLGTVLGSALSLFLIFAAFLRHRDRFRFSLTDRTILKRIGGRLLPTMVFTTGGYVNLLVDQVVASGIKGGAVSLLAYSQFLLLLPYTLVALPLLTALFPEMARQKGERQRGETLNNGSLLLGLALLPLLVGALFFRTPLIELFYNHGEFPPGFVPEAAAILLAYAPTMVLLSANNLLQRFFMVEGRMVLLMGLTLASTVANLAMDILFASRFSVVGIALATSLNETWYFVVMIWLLRKSLPEAFSSGFRRFLGLELLAASAMAASLFLSTGVIALPSPEKRLSLVVASAAHGGIALLIYLAVLLLLGRKRLLALLGSRRAPGA